MSVLAAVRSLPKDIRMKVLWFLPPHWYFQPRFPMHDLKRSLCVQGCKVFLAKVLFKWYSLETELRISYLKELLNYLAQDTVRLGGVWWHEKFRQTMALKVEEMATYGHSLPESTLAALGFRMDGKAVVVKKTTYPKVNIRYLSAPQPVNH